MKKRLLTILVAIMMVLPAMAQFKIGPRLGVAINSLHFNKEALAEDNRAGFTGGLQIEFTAPIIGIGMDASLMYVKRSGRGINNEYIGSDYIDIPINVKYKLGIPVVKPFVFTGPDFAFLTSKKTVANIIKRRNFDVGWNFGFGVELINHLQLSAAYGIGLTKALEDFGLKDEGNRAGIEGKNRYWTVTAAWLF